MTWWRNDPRYGDPAWCCIHDRDGTRFVRNVPRKRRAPSRSIRFADLQPGAVLIHRSKSTSLTHTPSRRPTANENTLETTHSHTDFAIVTDRWFDPVAGQKDPLRGEMAGIRTLMAGRVLDKHSHTLRGLASNGYSYATPDQSAAILAFFDRHMAIRQEWRGGSLTQSEAIAALPTLGQLFRQLGIDP